MITKIIEEDLIQKTKSYILNASDIVIVTHTSPDGDAMGSSLGFAHFLRSIDKSVTVIVPNSYPKFLKWMPSVARVVNFEEERERCERVFNEADLIFALDFNVLTRIGAMAAFVADAKATKILVDHHLYPGNFADVIISYPNISSTSEMIFRLICRMGYFTEMSKACAECIYTGMMTDTGAFTYNSNSSEIYSIISELLKKGVDKDAIYDKVNNNHSLSRFQLLGYALNNKMRVFPEYRTVLITLTKEELEKFSHRKGDTEGFVNMPLSIENIVFSAFFTEDAEKVKVSFRSRGDFPANEFSAKVYGGGGHLNAAGGESYRSMEETVEMFEKALAEYQTMLLETKL